MEFLFREGVPALAEVPLDNLLSTRRYPIEELYGILPLLLGSVWVTIGAVALSVPLGLATAVFIREIAPGWVREILKPLIEVLAGIPSVVLGFLGWLVVGPLVQTLPSLPPCRQDRPGVAPQALKPGALHRRWSVGPFEGLLVKVQKLLQPRSGVYLRLEKCPVLGGHCNTAEQRPPISAPSSKSRSHPGRRRHLAWSSAERRTPGAGQ